MLEGVVQFGQCRENIKDGIHPRNQLLQVDQDGQEYNFNRDKLANRYRLIDHEPSAHRQKGRCEGDPSSSEHGMQAPKNPEVLPTCFEVGGDMAGQTQIAVGFGRFERRGQGKFGPTLFHAPLETTTERPTQNDHGQENNQNRGPHKSEVVQEEKQEAKQELKHCRGYLEKQFGQLFLQNDRVEKAVGGLVRQSGQLKLGGAFKKIGGADKKALLEPLRNTKLYQSKKDHEPRKKKHHKKEDPPGGRQPPPHELTNQCLETQGQHQTKGTPECRKRQNEKNRGGVIPKNDPQTTPCRLNVFHTHRGLQTLCQISYV